MKTFVEVHFAENPGPPQLASELLEVGEGVDIEEGAVVERPEVPDDPLTAIRLGDQV